MTCCIEESVEKLEAVLQCVECELSALNEKLEDLKIEVITGKLESYLALNIAFSIQTSFFLSDVLDCDRGGRPLEDQV